jgi:hypothetical protein
MFSIKIFLVKNWTNYATGANGGPDIQLFIVISDLNYKVGGVLFGIVTKFVFFNLIITDNFGY